MGDRGLQAQLGAGDTCVGLDAAAVLRADPYSRSFLGHCSHFNEVA